MSHRKWTVAGLSAVTVAALAIYETTPAGAQQGVPAQGGQPSQQPRPANPEPNPSNPQPRQVAPQITPNQPTTQNPTATPGTNPATAAGRYQRPFAFQSQQMESRFNDSTRQLVGLEQRMTRSNQDALKRLSALRSLPADQQNAAMVSLIQQMLLDQGQLQKYLVQSRTAWSGEIDAPSGTETPETPASGVPTADVPQNTPR